MRSTARRGADCVVATLRAAGVSKLFTLSGNHIMSVFDAAIGTDIELVHVRHEAAAVHMADAWGRLTGEPGVALLTGGPGHANGVPALYTALSAESPVVMLSGHAPLGHMGMGAFQELRQADLAAPVSKASWAVDRAEDIGHDLGRALQMARSGRPGPVHLSLPSDQLEAPVAGDHAGSNDPALQAATDQSLGEAAAMAVVAAIRAASRPILLAAPFMNRGPAASLMVELAETLGVPWAAMESPRGLAEPSLGALAEVLPLADLVILFGKRLDYTLKFGSAPTLAPDAKFIQIDPEATAIERTRRLVSPARVLSATVADLAPAARELIAAAGSTRSTGGWYGEATAAIAHRPAAWPGLRSTQPGRVHPLEVCRAVQSLIDRHPDTVLVADGGEYAQWAQGFIRAKHRITNGPAGAIGAAPPFAAAAQLALPDALVVAFMGDGSFGFHLAELDTAVRHRLPYLAFVGNDATWNAEQQIQRREYGSDRLIGCELLPTRYDLAVAGLGGHGELVDDVARLPEAIARARASRRPACINVMIEKWPAPVISRTA